jgi:hypothetical protein
MNANDARLTEVFTAQNGSSVDDQLPNAPNGGPFDLIFEGVAGNAIGSGGLPYTLTLTAVDDTMQAPVPGMSIGPLNQAFDLANGWQVSGGGPNYEKAETFNITPPAGLRGHVCRYLAALWTHNGQIVSIVESEPFVLL